MGCCCSNGGGIVAALLGAAGAIGLVIAGGAGQPDKPTTANVPAAPTAPAQLQPDEQAMQDAWMAAATPGEHHAALNAFIGNWDIKMWWEMAPGQREESGGTMACRWVLGERWVEMKMTSEMMGMPFEGLGYFGYDNVAQKYVTTWTDSTTTTMLVDKGVSKDGGKTIVTLGEFTDPMGAHYNTKNVWSVKGEDQLHLAFWHQPDGGEYTEAGGITFTRR